MPFKTEKLKREFVKSFIDTTNKYPHMFLTGSWFTVRGARAENLVYGTGSCDDLKVSDLCGSVGACTLSSIYLNDHRDEALWFLRENHPARAAPQYIKDHYGLMSHEVDYVVHITDEYDPEDHLNEGFAKIINVIEAIPVEGVPKREMRDSHESVTWKDKEVSTENTEKEPVNV